MKYYSTTKQDSWTGRKTDVAEYWYQKIKFIDLFSDTCLSRSAVFIGYPNDEGVHLNQGRRGAALGPESIRKMMGTMAWHLGDLSLFDGGDFVIDNVELAQESLSQGVEKVLSVNSIPIVLGGGHDLAYGHFKGIHNFIKSKSTEFRNIGIINFDAHFDLRPLQDKGNSGTPFYQMAQLCKDQNEDFNYLALGIQKAANPKSLFDRADQFNVSYVLSDQMMHFNRQRLSDRLQLFIDRVDHIYLSIDLDGFSSSYAPGVSAPSPMGFSPNIILDLLSIIVKSKKLISFDVVEMNPSCDQDNSTARLAARLIEHILCELILVDKAFA